MKYEFQGSVEILISTPSPNDLVIGESVRYVAEQGFRYYITMSAASDKRLHAYYVTKFNPVLNYSLSCQKSLVYHGIIRERVSGYL
jgi:hypothetical protein